MKVVILLSGGLDSTTCMAVADNEGLEIYPLTLFYGQRHNQEVERARDIAKHYSVLDRHKVIDVSFIGDFGTSSLTDYTLEVRTDGLSEDIPNTYVPARNLLFISIATAYAESIRANKIMLGVSAIDYSGYPDCRGEFIESMNETINLATKAGVTPGQGLEILTPLIHLDKQETVKLGTDLNAPYKLTTSCYLGREKACGRCDSCLLRLQGFKKNNLEDPINYIK